MLDSERDRLVGWDQGRSGVEDEDGDLERGVDVEDFAAIAAMGGDVRDD